MRYGLAGHCDLDLLAPLLPGARSLPRGQGAPAIPVLAKALLALGESVVVYTLDETVARPVRFDGPNLTVWVGPFRTRHRMRDLMRFERDTVRGMIDGDPADAVNAWWAYEYALGALAARPPVLVTVCDWAPSVLRYSPDLYRLGKLAMYLMTLRRAENVAAVSESIARRLRLFGAAPVLLSEPVSDLSALRPAAKPADGPLMAVASGFGRLKNLETLLRAFPRVRERHPAIRLALYGHGHERGGSTEAWARERDLAAGIDFVGHRPHAELLRALALARIFVHPSREEAFGRTVAEAMSLGTPVIGHRTGGAVPWLLEEGRCGVLTDANDPVALADAICGLLADPVRANALAQAASISVAARFGDLAVAARYRDCLRRIAGKRDTASSTASSNAARGTVDK